MTDTVLAPAPVAGEQAPVAPVAAPAVPTQAAPAQEPVAGQPAEPVAVQTHTPPVDTVTVLEGKQGEDGSFSYEPTGNAGLDVALTYLGSLGFAGDDPAMIAAASGDFALLEAQVAALGPKAAGWEQMLNLAKSAYQANTKAVAERNAATQNHIIAAVGSVEVWQEVVQWAATNADADEKQAINELIDAGGIKARAAAMLLHDTYNKANTTTIVPRPAAKDTGGNHAGVVRGPLSPSEYGAAVRELQNKLGNRMEGSPEYADLQRRLRA